ncbi:hypothetical protein RB653_007718 [Dictyostelium firmibasis]|uniref:FNIP repeat-containing protein n=1 Tax=Dictyostelium firmibasis TaxID=79012 RepID=A0AAN7YM93_9MYCE
MERILISWLLSKNDLESTKFLKKISDNGLFITIESLENFFQPFLSPLNIFENDKIEKELKYGLEDSEIMNLYEMLKNLIITNRGKKPSKNYFVYSFKDSMFNELLNEIKTSNVTCLPILIYCLDLIRNNKNQLTKPKLDSTQNNNYNNNNNNNNNKCDMDNSIVFFKIWRNSVIKNEIMSEIKKLNNHLEKFTFYSISELEKYKYKNYLNHVVLDFKKVMEKNLFRYEGDMINNYFERFLPSKIKTLEINGGYNFYIKPSSFPSSLIELHFETGGDFKIGEKRITINYPVDSKFFNYFKNLKKVIFDDNFNSVINENSIPEGVEYIKFKNDHLDFLINPKIFPKTLKTIKICENKNNLINKIQNNEKESTILLPNTIETLISKGNSIFLSNNFNNENLTNLNINMWPKNLVIKKDTFPQNLKILTLGGLTEIKKNSFPNSITRLTLTNYFKIIQPGMLPNNLEYLSFQEKQKNQQKNTIKSPTLTKRYQQTLTKGSLPTTLKILKLGEHHFYMDVLANGILTPFHCSLKKLSIIIRNPLEFKLPSNNLKVESEIIERAVKWRKNKFIPETLKHIVCKTNSKYPLLLNQLLNEPFIVGIPATIKLDEQSLDELPPISMLKSLTSLKIHDSFDKLIYTNQLPINSLNHLNFGYLNSKFSKNIITNSLPFGLKTLMLPPLFDCILNIDEHLPNLELLVIGLSNPSNIIYDPLKSLNLKLVIVFNENKKFLFNNNNNSNNSDNNNNNNNNNNFKTLLEPILKITPSTTQLKMIISKIIK